MTEPRDNAPSPPTGLETVEHLVERLADLMEPSTVIVCVGNELRGDDGAAAAVAARLAGAVPWKVYDTQAVPESFLMKIVERKPGSVVLVDALNFNARPGAIELVESEKIAGQGPGTHGPAPVAFLEILRMFHPCRRAVLGIQPRNVGFGEKMSGPVKAAVDLVVKAFETLAAAADAQ